MSAQSVVPYQSGKSMHISSDC